MQDILKEVNKMKKEIKNLVIERLRIQPIQIKFSIIGYGDFTKDELINEVKKESDIGIETINLHLQMIRNMPYILK